MVLWAEVNRSLRNMTSAITTTLKTAKKITSNPSLTVSSPAGQKTIEEMLGAEKQSATSNIQTIQTTLLAIQETIMKMQENMSKNHVEMKGDINKLEAKVDTIQQAIEKNEQKLQVVEIRSEQNEKK
uniref:Uncharacterized protein n=1 Tax=Micrurus lemniscatus lemniscatus TaxID=129467 RepID=A0A2D4J924_MICLE